MFRFLLNVGLFRPRGIPVETYPRSPSLPQLTSWLDETALEVMEVGMTFVPTAFFHSASHPAACRACWATHITSGCASPGDGTDSLLSAVRL